jgi:hypothetical protein
MASHLSSIGMPVASQDEIVELVERIESLGEDVRVEAGHYRRCASRCGAELWLQYDEEGRLRGLTPWFAGPGRTRARLTARLEDPDHPLDGAFHGWANPPADGTESGSFPFVFDAPDFACRRDLALPALVDARVAAFAHEVACHNSEAAYLAARQNDPPLATRVFIPAGLFQPADEAARPEAIALLSGIVRETAERTNDWTGARYRWALVESYDSCFDVVIDPALLGEAPAVGGVVSSSFWLCGRVEPAPS